MTHKGPSALKRFYRRRPRQPVQSRPVDLQYDEMLLPPLAAFEPDHMQQQVPIGIPAWAKFWLPLPGTYCFFLNMANLASRH